MRSIYFCGSSPLSAQVLYFDMVFHGDGHIPGNLRLWKRWGDDRACNYIMKRFDLSQEDHPPMRSCFIPDHLFYDPSMSLLVIAGSSPILLFDAVAGFYSQTGALPPEIPQPSSYSPAQLCEPDFLVKVEYEAWQDLKILRTEVLLDGGQRDDPENQAVSSEGWMRRLLSSMGG